MIWLRLLRRAATTLAAICKSAVRSKRGMRRGLTRHIHLGRAIILERRSSDRAGTAVLP